MLASHISVRESSLTHNFIISIAFKGISPKATVMSVKKESEDPNYYEYSMQGNIIL